MASLIVLEDSELELLPLQGSKSSVWRYFGFLAREGQFVEKDKKKRQHVYCKVCRKQLSYVGNTTNLTVHLKNHHRDEYDECQMAEKGPSIIEATQSKQKSIEDAFQGATPLPHSSPRWKKLTDSVCYFIAKDGQPLDTVNDKGFRHMLTSFEPRYIPPDRKAITNHYLPDLYVKQKERIAREMGQASYFAVTTNGWTSRANESYLSLTVHYIDKEWKLQSHLLETRHCPESHTGENLATELEGMLATWKLSAAQMSAATTDNAANIVLAMKLLGWGHFRCFSHSLQLAINQALVIHQISTALARARNLVTHFHHSARSSHLLKEKQKDLKHPSHSLVRQVATRWNSVYYYVAKDFGAAAATLCYSS